MLTVITPAPHLF